MLRNNHTGKHDLMFKILGAIALYLISITAYALPFTISPVGTLPTTVNSGGTVTAAYTVVNNTGEVRADNFVKSLPPNVTQNTYIAGSCQKTFTLQPHQSTNDRCTLNLTISGAVNANDANPANHLFVCFPQGRVCTGTNSPLNVSVVIAPTVVSLNVLPTTASIPISGTQQFQAIATFSNAATKDLTSSINWASSNPAFASINNSGLALGLSPGTTSITATTGAITSNASALTVTGVVLTSITVTPGTTSLARQGTQQFTATGHYSDTSSQDITSSVNWVSSNTAASTITNGGLATGVANGTSNITASLNSITSNTAVVTVQQYAYITADTLEQCPYNTNGTIGACVTTGSNYTYAGGMAVNSTSPNFYISDSNANTLDTCPINADGSLGACVVDQTVSSVETLALNPSSTILYSTGLVNGVDYCPINSDGSIGTCATTGSGPNSFTEGIAINAANTFAYITYPIPGDVYLCPINPNGSFGTCVSGATGFHAPTQVAINAAKEVLYVTNANNNTISVCTINSTDGTLSNCVSANATGLSTPTGITVNSAGTMAYIASSVSGTITLCNVANDGTFSSCSTTGSNTTDIFQIILN